MKLHELHAIPGANKAVTRKGREVVDNEALKAKGLVKKTLDGVKVLGNGELTKALTVKAAAYSASAKEKIEKAGGKAEVM